ncbi:tetratricopeptide repeat protein [Arcticibacter tournemirensis]|uniref:Tetratricopeptide repeat protein n=1 Tax=Arcticibacter tournemirensis TaxID=699437 RepID=A0A4Q0M3C1_9SPHI|nr:tetratricopeptide repeat protein [Arcticibacter tournemirensis]RXF67354.1 tetratricopeptide repeat protein [Arcticibacter tournemirensis]
MKRSILIMIWVLQASFIFGQQVKKHIVKGNELYQQQNYKEAETNYRKSVDPKAHSIEGTFNLGDALYKQKKFAEAGEQFSKIAASATDKQVLSHAYHNLGNSLLSSKKIEESIEAYKKALLNNPKDDQTRYNLAYAKELLKQQQQNKQNQNKQNNQNQNNKDQDKKDQQNKDQNKKDQDKKDQDKQNQDKKDQQKDQQPNPNQLSKEDAERMLEALNNQEQGTQDKLKNKKLRGGKARITKDW